MAVRILTNRRERFDDSIFLAGFHGFGGTGYIAVSYLISNLSAKRIGFVQTQTMPPFTFMDGRRLITPFEVYRKERLVFLKTEFSPHRDEEVAFGESVARWVMEKGFKEAVLIGGLDGSLREDGDESPRVIATKAFLTRGRKLEIPLLEPGLVVYGPIATMMVNFEINNFPAAALLCYADVTKPDFKAAGQAVKVLCNMYGLEVDISDLDVEAWSLEEEMERRLAQVEKVLNGMYV
ncbi:MAG: PAC2 family protein [Candidatus Bathyarchaeia archaeon]